MLHCIKGLHETVTNHYTLLLNRHKKNPYHRSSRGQVLGYLIPSLHLKLEIHRSRDVTLRPVSSILPKCHPASCEGFLHFLRLSFQLSLHGVVSLALHRLNLRRLHCFHSLRLSLRLNERMSFTLCLDCTHSCVEDFQLRHDGVKQLCIRIHNNLRLEGFTHTRMCVCVWDHGRIPLI